MHLFVYGTLTDPDTVEAVLETFSYDVVVSLDGS